MCEKKIKRSNNISYWTFSFMINRRIIDFFTNTSVNSIFDFGLNLSVSEQIHISYCD